MHDWDRFVGFNWDSGNSSKSEIKHRVTRKEAEELFFNEPLLIAEDVGHSDGERRFQAMGRTNAGRLLFAAFTLREAGTLIRVISLRDMKAKERHRYAEKA